MSLERPKGFKCKDSMAAKGPVICSPQGQTRSRMKATSCHQVFSALQLRVSSSAPPSFGVTQTLEQARRHRGDGAGRTRPLLLSSASRAGPARELDSDVWGFYRNEVLPPRARSREHVPRPTSHVPAAGDKEHKLHPPRSPDSPPYSCRPLSLAAQAVF